MSVVGIDFGTQNCTIAAAQKGGVDVLINEVSARQTPCIAGFGEKERYIGESGLTQYARNIKNTVTNVKRLIGHQWNDEDFQNELKKIHFKTFEKPNHEIGIDVMYCNERKQFDPVSITGMILLKLKETAEKALERQCKDVVIAVPGYWTVQQRQAFLDATRVAGLNCLRLLNDHTASALQYGIYKTNLSDTDPIYVLFVDMGYSNTTVSVVEFLKGKLRVVSAAYDRNLGGRDFDDVLVHHFAKEFKEKYKIDILTNERALIRLEVACERMKKVLNTVAEAPINIDSIMNDVDVRGNMKRADYDVLCAPLNERLAVVVQQALTEANLTADKLTSIEITGGATRLQSVQNKLTEFFKRDLSRTLNHEESVAKGCALQCAMLSPIFKVRDFAVIDISPYPIKVSWNKSTENPAEETSVEVFARNNPLPSPKMITLHRKDPLELSIEYSQPELLPSGTSTFLGKWSIPAVPAQKPDGSKLRVKIKLDIHGIVSVESAQLVETLEEGETAAPAATTPAATPAATTPAATPAAEGEAPKEGETPMQETPTTPQEGAKPEEKKTEEAKKKKVRRTDLTLNEQSIGLTQRELQELTENEARMAAADRLSIETAEKKNAVETYIYDMRSKLSESLAPFVLEQDSQKFVKLLDETENWLYEEGADCTKSVYVTKLDELKKLGDPITRRRYEAENRYDAVVVLRGAVDQFKLAATIEDPKYDHIEKEEKTKIVEECNSTIKSVNELLSKQDLLPKHADPIITCADIIKKKNDLERFCNTILNKPKPKPVPKPEEKKDVPKPEEKKEEPTATPNDVPMKDAEPATTTEQPQQAKPDNQMDLD